MLKPVTMRRAPMPAQFRSFATFRLLALCALALGACAAPAVLPPTNTPTQPATDMALSPTAAQTAPSTVVPANIPVPATSAVIRQPTGLAFDIEGDLFISDCGDYALLGDILKVDANGQLTLYAGDGQRGFTGDSGPAHA